MKITLAILLLLVIALLLLPRVGIPASLYVVTPPINNQPVLEKGSLPATCLQGNRIELVACRGEYESGSFVVEAETPLQEVVFSTAPLTGPMMIPLDLQLVQRVGVAASVGNVAMPWLLVHNPGMLELVHGYSPTVAALSDALIGPEYHRWTGLAYKQAHECWTRLKEPLVDSGSLLPMDIPFREQFWVTVHVPPEAPAGNYQGSVQITPKNAPPMQVEVSLRVLSFDLLPAPYEYSVYHPTDNLDPPLTEAQLLNDFRSMAAHGLLNPNLYVGPEGEQTGAVSFDRLNHYLDLREQAGLPKGNLYLFDGAGLVISDRPLTPAEKARTKEVAQQTVAWAKSRGYGGVYFMGCDEFSGERLKAERESWEAVHSGGAKVYVACYPDFETLVGDLLDCAVLMDPDAGVMDYNQWTGTTAEVLRGRGGALLPTQGYWGSGALLQDPYPQILAQQHQRGYRVFTYMDPVGGSPWPEDHRRCRGLGLWQAGLDGTMTWAWTSYRAATPRVIGQEVPLSTHGFILRGEQAPLETLALVGFREGYDDARYLATLQDKITHGGVGADAAAAWLKTVTLATDLSAWRKQVIFWIEVLS